MVEPFSSESEWDEMDDPALLCWLEDVWDWEVSSESEQEYISAERLAAEEYTALAEWVAKREVENRACTQTLRYVTPKEKWEQRAELATKRFAEITAESEQSMELADKRKSKRICELEQLLERASEIRAMVEEGMERLEENLERFELEQMSRADKRPTALA